MKIENNSKSEELIETVETDHIKKIYECPTLKVLSTKSTASDDFSGDGPGDSTIDMGS